MLTRPATEEESPTIPRDERDVREMAVKRIQRKRRFQARAVAYAAICTLLTIVWAIS